MALEQKPADAEQAATTEFAIAEAATAAESQLVDLPPPVAELATVAPAMPTPPTDAAEMAIANRKPVRRSYRWWALSCTSLGSLMAALNGGTLIIALPVLLRSLQNSP